MKRVLTAALLIPLVVALIFLGPPLAVRVGLALVAVLCLRECLDLLRAGGMEPFPLAAYAAAAVLLLVPGIPEMAFLTAFVLMLMAAAMTRESLAGAAGASAGTLFGVVYCAGPFLLGARLHALSPHWLFAALAVNWIGDSAAYYVGRAFGKHKLAPRTSPNKTWEGAIAAALAGTAAGAAYLLYFEPRGLTPALAAALPLAANLAGQIGDLAESALKRGVGVKDSGSLLPGHGGMLDRMDSALFALPAAYLVLILARLTP